MNKIPDPSAFRAMRALPVLLLSLLGLVSIVASPYAGWVNGPPTDPGYFPIAVWLQNPNNAERYKAAVWNCIECTRISNTEVKPTPAQVRTEVWMALIHGSQGLIYFVHQFQPVFREAALFDDPEMLDAVTRINRQIHELAPVLNSPSLPEAVELGITPAEVPVATMVKRHGDALWLFAVSMRPQSAAVTFQFKTAFEARTVEVLDESRSIPVRDDRFVDHFEP